MEHSNSESELELQAVDPGLAYLCDDSCETPVEEENDGDNGNDTDNAHIDNVDVVDDVDANIDDVDDVPSADTATDDKGEDELQQPGGGGGGRLQLDLMLPTPELSFKTLGGGGGQLGGGCSCWGSGGGVFLPGVGWGGSGRGSLRRPTRVGGGLA